MELGGGGGGEGGHGWRGFIIIGDGWLIIKGEGWLIISGCDIGKVQGACGRGCEVTIRIEVPIGPCQRGKHRKRGASGGCPRRGRNGEREQSERAIGVAKGGLVLVDGYTKIVLILEHYGKA